MKVDVLVGSQFEGHVKALSFKGLGIVNHPNGQVFFVRGVWPGDEGKFEIESTEKRYGFAKLIEITKPSESRRIPPCPHFGLEVGKCGGCPWMIANYSSQIIEKENILKQLLHKSKLLTSDEILKPIIRSPEEFNYRNRAQLKTDGKSLGYVSAGTNILAPIDNCIILTPINQQTVKDLKSKLPNENWIPEGKYDFNFIEIDEGVNTDTISLNQRRAFQQGNTSQNEFMKSWVNIKVSLLDKSQEVLELFCGSGNFTEIISAAGFQKIVASEVSDIAISELKNKNLKNVTATKANIFNPASWDRLKSQSNPSILFLDPPREGFKEIDRFLKKFKSVKTILYISCDISTFIYDCQKIKELGFEIKELVPVDQFPQTPHLEVLSILELSN